MTSLALLPIPEDQFHFYGIHTTTTALLPTIMDCEWTAQYDALLHKKFLVWGINWAPRACDLTTVEFFGGMTYKIS